MASIRRFQSEHPSNGDDERRGAQSLRPIFVTKVQDMFHVGRQFTVRVISVDLSISAFMVLAHA